jgi:putative addiction module killer protein
LFQESPTLQRTRLRSRAFSVLGWPLQEYQKEIILKESVAMEMQPLEIRAIELENGNSPYLKWYRRQAVEIRAEIDARLVQVRKRNFGDHRNLKRGLVELRFAVGKGLRIYGGEWRGRLFLLLQGGYKAGQSEDIAEATRLWVAFTKEAGRLDDGL